MTPVPDRTSVTRTLVFLVIVATFAVLAASASSRAALPPRAIPSAGPSGAPVGDTASPSSSAAASCPDGYLYGERSIRAAPAVGNPARAIVSMAATTALTEPTSHVTSEVWVSGTYQGNRTWIEAGIEWYADEGSPRVFIGHQNDDGVFTWDYEAPAAFDTPYQVFIYNLGGNAWSASVNGALSAPYTIDMSGPITDFGGESYLGSAGSCNTLADSLAGIGPWRVRSLYDNSTSPYLTARWTGGPPASAPVSHGIVVETE